MLNIFTFKDVANALQVSTQAIYQKKNELKKLGYIYECNGKSLITQDGLNYLKEKRIINIQENKKISLKNDLNNNAECNNSNGNIDLQVLQTELKYLQKHVENMEKLIEEKNDQISYFKTKYEEVDSLYKDLVNQKLLSNNNADQKKWWHFWN